MIKNITFFIFFTLVSFFSFAKELNSNYNAVPINLFNDMYEYTQKNLDKINNNAYKQVGKEYGVNAYEIRQIINGNTFYCFKIFDKLDSINPDKYGNYKAEDFLACRDKIQNLVNNYVSSSLIKKSVNDSLKGENFFSDGDEDNSSYDLLVDFKNLTEILFKKEIILNTKFNLLAGTSDGGGIGNNNSSSSGSNTFSGNKGYGGELTNNLGNFLKNDSINNNVDSLSNNGNLYNLNKDNLYGSDNLENSNSLLSNIPIGSNCGTGNGQNLNSNTNGNNSNFSLSYGNDVINQDNLINSGESYNNNLFSIDKGEIPVGLDDIGLSGNKLGFNSGSNSNGGGAGESNSCPSDDLLSICIKLVPSGPRGPVGGTTKKRSIEEVIDKISDTLKYMRQVWIIPAGHGDEALDIDFKHLSLPDIFVFNIILTPKPVFNFKKDKKVQKQANEADTELENVPRKLAKLYSDLNIVDGFNSRADFKKYLITNFDKIKPYRRVNLNYPEKVTNDSASGIFDEAEKYSALLTNILNMLNSMEELTRNWIGSSIALEEKSTY